MSTAILSSRLISPSTQVFGGNCKSSLVAESAPMIFLLGVDASVGESVALLAVRQGWQCESFVDAREFLACRPSDAPSCLVLDACLPGTNVLELQRRIAAERPSTSIIFFSNCADLTVTVKAMKAGAIEFFTKPVSDQLLLSSISEALERSRIALSREREMKTLRARYSALSRREREVMALVASGLLNKQVGGELGISEITVKAHRGQAMQKMQATSLAHLVTMAFSLGLIEAFGK